MGSSLRNYTNFLQLLKSRGFIDLTTVQQNHQNYYLADYGPPGTLLRRNILKQWWKMMSCQLSNVFPVESPVLQVASDVKSSNLESLNGTVSFKTSLRQDCISKYLQVMKLTNGRLPVAIASAGPCLSWRTVAEEPEEKTLLFGGSNFSQLLYQNYTLPKGVNRIMDNLLQLRLSWWKKFSRNPANFSVASNNNHTNSGISSSRPSNIYSSMYIMYQFPWGTEKVEEVRNTGDQYLAALQKNYQVLTGGKKACLPYCLECETSLEMAAGVWLVDSFQERQKHQRGKKNDETKVDIILHLHPQIAPYQVALVVMPTSSASSLTEKTHICTQLERDLHKAGVSVLNSSQHGSTAEAHFRRNDHLGIPYTIIVEDTTLSEGVIHTRHRDTNIKVASHISSIIGDLRQNLTAQLE